MDTPREKPLSEKIEKWEVRVIFKELYFFFSGFFFLPLAALATIKTSKAIIGFNLYLKFAKALALRLLQAESIGKRLLTSKQTFFHRLDKKDAKVVT